MTSKKNTHHNVASSWRLFTNDMDDGRQDRSYKVLRPYAHVEHTPTEQRWLLTYERDKVRAHIERLKRKFNVK
jgi:hypothetical protein